MFNNIKSTPAIFTGFKKDSVIIVFNSLNSAFSA